jgi:4'-phosphopantetheinyl transferase
MFKPVQGAARFAAYASPRREPIMSGPKVRIWSTNLDQVEFSAASNRVFSNDEMTRAARFRFERDRRRFLAARFCLRHILATCAGADPAELDFSYSAHGKPALAKPASNFFFNISHSHHLALFVVTTGVEVGVDIEKIREDVETAQLATRFFSTREVAEFRALPPHQRVPAFFRIWTCKEAFLKAKGSGLLLPLDSFDVEVTMSEPARLLATRPDPGEADRWSVAALDVAPGYAAAVVVLGASPELVQRPWPE